MSESTKNLSLNSYCNKWLKYQPILLSHYCLQSQRQSLYCDHPRHKNIHTDMQLRPSNFLQRVYKVYKSRGCQLQTARVQVSHSTLPLLSIRHSMTPSYRASAFFAQYPIIHNVTTVLLKTSYRNTIRSIQQLKLWCFYWLSVTSTSAVPLWQSQHKHSKLYIDLNRKPPMCTSLPFQLRNTY